MTLPRDYEFTFKLLVLGDSGVGKTCLIRRFTDDDFSQNFVSTIGIDSKSRIVEIDGIRIRLQIWDTAGQERFRTLTGAYFRGAMGIMLGYDVTSESSFNNVSNWLDNIEYNASRDVCKILVGNKSDTSLEHRAVTDKRGKERADECSLAFMETSAKSGDNVEKAFMDLAKQVKKQKDFKDKLNAPKDLSPFSVQKKDAQQPQSSGQCC